jgi:hypothetical protein
MSAADALALPDHEFMQKFFLPMCTSFTVCPKAMVYSGDMTLDAKGNLNQPTEDFGMVQCHHYYVGVKDTYTHRYTHLADMTKAQLSDHKRGRQGGCGGRYNGRGQSHRAAARGPARAGRARARRGGVPHVRRNGESLATRPGLPNPFGPDYLDQGGRCRARTARWNSETVREKTRQRDSDSCNNLAGAVVPPWMGRVALAAEPRMGRGASGSAGRGGEKPWDLDSDGPVAPATVGEATGGMAELGRGVMELSTLFG